MAKNPMRLLPSRYGWFCGGGGWRRGAKRDLIREAVHRLPNRFRYADLERALPAVSRPTIARASRVPR
jgi:hypothetical protein